MLTFKEYIAKKPTVLTEEKNLHMEHIEEEIINFGHKGALGAIAFLNRVGKLLSGHVSKKFNVTIKWDGAPAIFVGINPENGKFFVATKSVFNKKTAKINYTAEDISRNHGSGGLTDKLSIALQYLPQIGIEGVLQGDMMFTSEDLKVEEIDGQSYLTFGPNTITYAVPAESTLAKKMQRAKIGIVFHTEYKGDTLSDMSASFNVKAESLRQTKDVWFDDATYKDASGSVTMTEQETAAFQKHMTAAKTSLKNINRAKLDSFIENNVELIKLVKMHLNSKIRNDQHIGDVEEHVNGLIEFIHNRLEKEKEKVKTDKTKQAREDTKRAFHANIDQSKSLLLDVFQFEYHINEAKLLLVRKLESVEGIGTFLKTENGYQVTAPEGFVAVDHLTNKAVKLVDRLEFSRANFNANREWTK